MRFRSITPQMLERKGYGASQRGYRDLLRDEWYTNFSTTTIHSPSKQGETNNVPNVMWTTGPSKDGLRNDMTLKKKYGGVIKNSCRKVSHIPNIPLHVLVPWCQRWKAGNRVIVNQTPITDQWPTFFPPFVPTWKEMWATPSPNIITSLLLVLLPSLFVLKEYIIGYLPAHRRRFFSPSVHIYIHIYIYEQQKTKKA